MKCTLGDWIEEEKVKTKSERILFMSFIPLKREREGIVRDSIKETKEDYVTENETDK